MPRVCRTEKVNFYGDKVQNWDTVKIELTINTLGDGTTLVVKIGDKYVENLNIVL